MAWLGCFRQFNDGDGFDEAVTLSGHGLNVTRRGRSVVKSRSKATDNDIEAVLEIHVCVRPQPGVDLFACKQLSRSLQK